MSKNTLKTKQIIEEIDNLKNNVGRPLKYNYPIDCLSISERLAYRRLVIKAKSLFNIDIDSDTPIVEKLRIVHYRSKNRIQIRPHHIPTMLTHRTVINPTVKEHKELKKKTNKGQSYKSYTYNGIKYVLDVDGMYIKQRMIEAQQVYQMDKSQGAWKVYITLSQELDEYVEKYGKLLLELDAENKKFFPRKRKLNNKLIEQTIPKLVIDGITY